MYAEPHQQKPDQEDFTIEQQINLFTTSLPQIRRGQSDIFFKQIYREEGFTIASVQIGFHVARITPQMYDFISVLVNDIHCCTEENLKLIIDGDQLWATSTIIYPLGAVGEPAYNMIQSNNREALMKTRQILRDILKECKARYEKSEPDEEILKAIKGKFKNIEKAFKDPNADF